MNTSDKRRAERMQKRAWLIALVGVGLVTVPVIIAMGAASNPFIGAVLAASAYVIVFSIFKWGTLPIFRAVLGPEETTSPSKEQDNQ